LKRIIFGWARIKQERFSMVSEKVFGIDKLNTIQPPPAKSPIEEARAGRNVNNKGSEEGGVQDGRLLLEIEFPGLHALKANSPSVLLFQVQRRPK